MAGVRVFCRLRPRLQTADAPGGADAVTLDEGTCTVTVARGADRDRDRDRDRDDDGHAFAFDGVLGPRASQADAFGAVAAPLVDAVLSGINGCAMAYGQTASGKTHTMEAFLHGGGGGAVGRIFAAIDAAPPSMEFTIRLQALEVYNERIFDLLHPEDDAGALALRYDAARGGVVVDGASEECVASPDEAAAWIAVAAANRSTGVTGMNDASSRSHCVVRVTLEARDGAAGTLQRSTLSLVDLAGSECVSRTQADGQTLDEARSINRSLFTLSKVVHVLSTARGGGGGGGPPAPHVPYRDSKLTRLLQDSLGGNAMTALVVCVSPCASNVAESLSTLRFAMRAKDMPNAPVVNRLRPPAELERLLRKAERAIDAQGAVILALQEQLLATLGAQRRKASAACASSTAAAAPEAAGAAAADGAEGNDTVNGSAVAAAGTTPSDDGGDDAGAVSTAAGEPRTMGDDGVPPLPAAAPPPLATAVVAAAAVAPAAVAPAGAPYSAFTTASPGPAAPDAGADATPAATTADTRGACAPSESCGGPHACEASRNLASLLIVHRQLLRKYATLDADAAELHAAVRVRDARVADLEDELATGGGDAAEPEARVCSACARGAVGSGAGARSAPTTLNPSQAALAPPLAQVPAMPQAAPASPPTVSAVAMPAPVSVTAHRVADASKPSGGSNAPRLTPPLHRRMSRHVVKPVRGHGASRTVAASGGNGADFKPGAPTAATAAAAGAAVPALDAGAPSPPLAADRLEAARTRLLQPGWASAGVRPRLSSDSGAESAPASADFSA